RRTQDQARVRREGPIELAELGADATPMASLLVDAMASQGALRRYVPMDVSERMVREAAAELVDDYPGLSVHGVIGDFERHLDRIPPPDGGPRLVALLGGTIGNFPPGSRGRLLRGVGGQLGARGRLALRA